MLPKAQSSDLLKWASVEKEYLIHCITYCTEYSFFTWPHLKKNHTLILIGLTISVQLQSSLKWIAEVLRLLHALQEVKYLFAHTAVRNYFLRSHIIAKGLKKRGKKQHSDSMAGKDVRCIFDWRQRSCYSRRNANLQISNEKTCTNKTWHSLAVGL